ncbi:MAG: MFS transporter [Sinobacteraceae bacterium]|nr:MFS transporter [Nevskiaceae bacterium]
MNPSPLQVTMLASVAAFVVQLDGSALNVALPTLGQEFGVPLTLLQWIVDAYTLTYACILLSAGAASDRFGASRVFAWGLGLFAFASVLCALSPRAELLIVGRVLQGAAGSILIPSSLALIHHVHGDEEGARIKAIGWWTAGGGVAITAGPVVGGVCIAYLGWRSMFLINVPICAVGMAVASCLPSECLAKERFPMRDRLGQILAAISMFGLVGGIIEGGSRGFGSSFALAGIAVFFAVGALCLRREARVPYPVLPLSLLQARTARVAIAAGFVLSFCAFGLVFALSVYYQLVQRYSAIETGLAFVPFALSITVANVIGSSVAIRIGTARTIVGALAAAALGCALLLKMEPSSSYLEMLAAQIIARLGVGAAVPLTTALLLSATSRAQSGIASAGLNAIRQTRAALGVAVFGAFMSTDPVRGFEFSTELAAALLLAVTIGAAFGLLRPGLTVR